ncbi:MAG: adenylate/guanylate cyclase domain-containing protein, partial [Planctomycetales bacterium]|nr:adenylate/guanylate cyclase domain-containing protein [Planctomycetales bacterium]
VDGQPAKEFELPTGGEFLIGETTFRFVYDEIKEPGSNTVVEHTLGTTVLKSGRFENATACLEALCQLPALIAESRSDVDFATRMADLLLDSLRGALAAAVIQVDGDDNSSEPAAEPKLLRWNTRGDAVKRFRPSRRLMNRALERGQSVVHLWTEQEAENTQFTMSSDLDWALCTPIDAGGSERWCLYVSGKRQFVGMQDVQNPEDLMAELRLAELMARFIGAVRRVRTLEQQQTEMRRFFSPAVVETLGGGESIDVLAPRQGPVSVLFCDVRGFSRKVEESKDDLEPLLVQVSQALSVMTGAILKYEGVIADFQGDAVLGFWGWPSHAPDAAALACRAALLIHRKFRDANQDPRHPLYGFRVGVGVGYGDAIAGRIGSQEQIKVGVFGPVVNLASRLQDLTKQVGVPILVDGATAAAIAETLPEGAERCRRVARLRPVGVETPVDACALTPLHSSDEPLDSAQLQNYDRAVEAVIAGDWGLAQQLLRELPAQDGPANFLRTELCRHGAAPPENWDGVLAMSR